MLGYLIETIICELKHTTREKNYLLSRKGLKLYFVFIIYLEEGKVHKKL